MTFDRDVLLKAVLQLPPEDRIAFLDEACATDTPLRLEIELLLGEYDDTEPLLPP